MNSTRRAYLDRLPFPPDPFQIEAMDSLDGGKSVLVSAPTGAGKTVVAAYGVHRALAAGGKAFYTTPLKALSNQKFGELSADHGPDRVGLLTGDTALRPDAPVVVMTTEVLRNMLLAGSGLLERLHTVVLDEVHYLQDPYRGGVWEEVIVLCPPEVTFVCLSATAGNAADLGDWLRSVRGPVETVVAHDRPVTLRHHFALVHRGGSRRDADPVELIPLLTQGRPSEEGLRVDRAVERAVRAGRPVPHWRGRGGGRPDLPYRSPRRSEIVDALEGANLLPAIVFIFSRAACTDAVHQCLNDGLHLTDSLQRAAIRRVAEERTAGLEDDDLAVLGYPEWLEGLEAGITAHHAGLVPAFREAVEECFAAGLLSVVFATETLSLGINMPARTAVIERFTKFGSAGRATLTSGEYAQLTGRAGRRGLDAEGHAVVLWTAETAFCEVARVAVAPPPDLRSSFHPSYNLAANLVRRFDRPTAVGILRRSFSQWQAVARGAGGRDFMVDHLSRRLAVLEELGYLDGWKLTTSGRRLARIYHDVDLLVAETLAGDALAGAEPAVLAGAISCLVFERRRARRHFGGGPRADRRHRGTAGAVTTAAPRGDRLGAGRRAELARRTAAISTIAERIRTLEEIHLVPRTRQPEPGLAGAVASWCRGAGLGTVLEVAARDVGELAPGDFVRTMKQVADLVGQVAEVTENPATVAAAREALGLAVRGAVAAGMLPATGSGKTTASATGAAVRP